MVDAGGRGHAGGGRPGDEVRDPAAPAVLRSGAGAGVPADGPVVRQRA